jgi:hypothetical protein
LKAEAGGDVFAEDRFGILCGHFLDLHTSRSRRHEDHFFGLTVDHDAQVEFAADIETFLDINLLYLPPFRSGLMRHESHAQHLTGELLGFLRGLGEFYTAALTSASGMDLRLDDNGAAKFLGSESSFISGINDFAPRDADAVTCKDLLGLILMNLHAVNSKTS